RRGDDELRLGAALVDRLDRRSERVEALAQPRQARLRRLGQLHAAPLTAEQLDAEEILEALDLVAHRGLRDMQLRRRLLERQVAGGGFEDAQRVQRRKTVRHFSCEFFLWLT